jgi:hypothetical protein
MVRAIEIVLCEFPELAPGVLQEAGARFTARSLALEGPETIESLVRRAYTIAADLALQAYDQATRGADDV